MNINEACLLLEIDEKVFENITNDLLKKKYHKMALKYHPDKNGNTHSANQYFQQINEAYHYLNKYLKLSINENENENENKINDYFNLLFHFISNILKGKYKDIIFRIIKIIVVDCNTFSLTIFDEIDKENAFEIYNFIYKYKKILYLNDDILIEINNYLINKFKINNSNLYILNPNINDLFNNNIFKLNIDNKIYLVPLWHNELYFENEIIVRCNPELPNNIYLDEDNNILIDIKIEILNLFKEKVFKFNIDNREFFIPIEELLIKKIQSYKINNAGISQIIENDIYNITNKSDIICNIILI